VGKLSDDMKKNAVVLQKPSGTIAIRVDLDAIQRKFYNALLFIAKQELKKNINKDEFSIVLSDLKTTLRRDGEADKNNSYYIVKLKELKLKNAEYNILGKDQNDWDIEGIVSLVSDLKIKRHRKTDQVVITFELANIIKRALIDPKGIYANINLVIIAGLKSKYAIILYELVKDYEKVEIPEMTIENFRKLFNVENKYPKMPDLKRWVLEPAIRELNENENVDFLVSYELKKTGKVYTHIKFHVKPKPAQIKLKQQAKKVLAEELKENTEAKELLAMIPPEYREKAKVVSVVLGGLKERGKDYTKAQIEYTVEKYKAGKVKDFVIYLKKAMEEDYAGFERVETDILTPEDAVGYSGYIYGKNGEKVVVRIGHVKKDQDGDYLVRLDRADTGELYEWWKKDEDWLLERARRKKEKKL